MSGLYISHGRPVAAGSPFERTAANSHARSPIAATARIAARMEPPGLLSSTPRIIAHGAA